MKTALSLLVVSNMYPSKHDPTYGTFVEIFCNGIQSEGAHIDLIAIKGRSHSILQLFKYVIASLRLIKKHLFGRHHIVYVHYLLHFAPLLWLLQSLRRRQLVLNAHGGDILPRGRMHHFLFKFVLRLCSKADAVVVPSRFFKEVASHQLDLKMLPVFIWPSGGVDMNLFNAKPRKPQHELQIVFVSRMDPLKGASTLVDAIGRLKQSGLSGVRFHFIGHALKKELEEYKSNLSLHNVEDICTYHGAMTHQQLADFLPECDALVFPTLYQESLGLVALEAMACGLPVIGSNRGALPEFILESKTGHLFEAGDASSLECAVQRFLHQRSVNADHYKNACRSMAEMYARPALNKSMFDWLIELQHRKSC